MQITQVIDQPCRGERILIAANLHNSESLMPHYTLQLLALLAVRPPAATFLSIYESGSSDDTGGTLNPNRTDRSEPIL